MQSWPANKQTRSQWATQKHRPHCTSRIAPAALLKQKVITCTIKLRRCIQRTLLPAFRFASAPQGVSTKPALIDWTIYINCLPKIERSCCTAFSTARVLPDLPISSWPQPWLCPGLSPWLLPWLWPSESRSLCFSLWLWPWAAAHYRLFFAFSLSLTLTAQGLRPGCPKSLWAVGEQLKGGLPYFEWSPPWRSDICCHMFLTYHVYIWYIPQASIAWKILGV